MSLLPSLFRQTDIPTTLGAKVVPPASKKPDPIKEFETGVHLPAHVIRETPVKLQPAVRVWFGGDWGTPKPPVQVFKDTPAEAAARTELMQDFKSLHDTYIRLGIDFNPFEIRRAAGVPIDSRPTNAQLGKMIDVMIAELSEPR